MSAKEMRDTDEKYGSCIECEILEQMRPWWI